MQAWWVFASCRGLDPDMFFPTSSDERDMEPAKQVCYTCPARSACLEYALRTNQKYGIWGGKSRRQRRMITRDRNLRIAHRTQETA